MTDKPQSLSARIRAGDIPASLQAISDNPAIKAMVATTTELTNSPALADAMKMSKAAPRTVDITKLPPRKIAKILALQASLNQMFGTPTPALKMPPAPLQREPDKMRELADIWFAAGKCAKSLASSEGEGWSKSRYLDAFIRISDLAETLADRMLGEGNANDLLSNGPYDPEVRRMHRDFAPKPD